MSLFEKIVLNPFLEIVEKYGHNNAFCVATKYYTYNEFARYISKIRKAIHYSAPKSKNIGLVANDDIETYAAIFAIWLEGFAYVPLHPLQPVERSLEIMSQSDVDLVINSGDNNLFPDITIIKSSRLEFDEFDLQPNSTPDNALAYILFTSGSTGSPKGVPIMRSSIGAFMKAFFEVGFKINHFDHCLQCSELAFDVSVQSFLVPLTKGAITYTIPQDEIKYSYIYGLLEDHKITFAILVPSMLRYLKPYFEELNFPSMRYCILTAEASPINLIKEWSNCIPNAEIYNFYGPTEATIYCTYYKFNKNGFNKHLNGMLSIGKAMNGISTIVIDEEGNALDANQKGELCVSGIQLTNGYLNNPIRTEESFIEKEWHGSICRFYKTGDYCFFDNEGDIMYAGRLDFQVKILGYRIELGEIEYHAREFLQVQNAIAISFENKLKNTEIALIVEGELNDTSFLNDYLKTKLPNYMVPRKIIPNKEFPLNSNGKVDRNMLKKNISL
jgi:D-alanine--poly(phosphoribitol) ligase subunit 1